MANLAGPSAETLHSTSADARTGSPVQRPLDLLGGIALAVAPLLVMGGVVTSPPQDSPSTADYIESLARDPFITSLSATLFHYGWIAYGLGALASVTLVRTRRGSALAVVGGVLTAITSLQISGLLLADWFNASLGRHLPLDQAATVFDGATDTALTVWLSTGQLAVLTPVVLFAGLARARLLSWWLVPMGAFPMVISPVVGGLFPGTAGAVAAGVAGMLAFAPTFVTAARLLRAARVTPAA